MALNTTNLETVINSKIASTTTATADKDLLLISKSVEALVPTVTVQAVVAEGATQVTAVQAGGATQVTAVQAAGATQVAAVQAAGSVYATSAALATAVTGLATSASVTTAVAAAVTDMATNASVTTAVANLVASAPATLDTLKELSDALGDDANFAATTTAAIGTKMNTANPTFTGTLDGAGNSYTNLHPAVTTASVTSAHALDLTLPFHDVTLTGTTLFSTSNIALGRISVVSMGVPASVVPSFGAEVKWAGDAEPTWADSTHWVISMTCMSSTVIVASATGFTA